jgi:uncharacterized protein YdaU (DUF1376 family)
VGGCLNFYKRHLGDYAKDAGHLSMLEHGAYTLLLDRYYTVERHIETREDAYRFCRARSREEKAAVDAVLREFFVTDGESFLNRRAEEEIAKAEHQRTVNQEIGKRGGRPKKTEPITESVSNEEPNRNPSQTPDSRLHTEPIGSVERKRATRKCPQPFMVTAEMLAWAAENVPAVSVNGETAKFMDHTFKAAISDWPGAWRNWMRKAVEFGGRGSVVPINRQEALEQRNRNVGEDWLREQEAIDASR